MFNLFNKKLAPGKIKPMVLIVLDGWGVAPAAASNAIREANPVFFNKLLSMYPNGQLLASGESVGLPAGEVGNTEVGHLNLGAGRVVLQDLVRIDKSIEYETFFDNDAISNAINHAHSNNSNLHIMGLVGRAGVHSSLNHLYAILEACKRKRFQNVFIHAFTDGRDSPPEDAINLIKEVEAKISVLGVGKIASISGRYWAMDRDFRWERIKTVYDALVNDLTDFVGDSAEKMIQAGYQRGETDEFIKPSLITINNTKVTIKDNDACIFFNYRIDRPRELTMAMTIPDFESLKSFEFGKDPEKGGRGGDEIKFEGTFKREKILKNLFFVTLTQYDPSIRVTEVAFPPEKVVNPLTKVLASAGIAQLHMAESEKERFVTYYFDGQIESKAEGEEFLIVPSPKVATYDLKPEMSLPSLSKEFKNALTKDKYGFFVINIANPDMVAHSGNMKATVKAIGIVDKYLEDLVTNILLVGGTAVITADHGNAEELLSYQGESFYFTSGVGEKNTEHSKSPVPIIIVSQALEGPRMLPRGALKDVAPTILKLMGVPKPPEMSGINLLE